MKSKQLGLLPSITIVLVISIAADIALKFLFNLNFDQKFLYRIGMIVGEGVIVISFLIIWVIEYFIKRRQK